MAGSVPATYLLENRARLFALVTVVAGVNALGTPIIGSIGAEGFLSALCSLFGVSAVIWFALFTIARLSFDTDYIERATRRDGIVTAVILATSLVPIAAVGSFGIFAGGIYCVFNSTTNSASRRIGLVLVALSCSLLWGRVLLVALGPQMLAVDGSFVGWMAGTRSHGNLVYFAGLQRPFVIGVYCSSLHNVSLGALLWTCVSQLLQLPVDRRWAATCAGVALAVFLINAFRLTAIAWYPADFVTLHEGWMAQVFGVASLLSAVLVILCGVHASTRARV